MFGYRYPDLFLFNRLRSVAELTLCSTRSLPRSAEIAILHRKSLSLPEMELSFAIIAILLVSGLVVGFINTLAGGGSAISLTVFMALASRAGCQRHQPHRHTDAKPLLDRHFFPQRHARLEERREVGYSGHCGRSGGGPDRRCHRRTYLQDLSCRGNGFGADIYPARRQTAETERYLRTEYRAHTLFRLLFDRHIQRLHLRRNGFLDPDYHAGDDAPEYRQIERD